MEFQLNRSERLVANAVSTDKTRPVLTCVHIRKGIIEAADGWIAVQRKISYQGKGKLLLRGKELSKCKGEVLTITKGGDAVAIQQIVGHAKETISLYPVSGTFPNIDKLYPETADEDRIMERLTGEKLAPFQIVLSREKLIRLLKSVDEDVVRFSFYGKQRPVKVETFSAKGLIMPMPVQWPGEEVK